MGVANNNKELLSQEAFCQFKIDLSGYASLLLYTIGRIFVFEIYYISNVLKYFLCYRRQWEM